MRQDQGNVTDLRYSQDHAVWALSVLALVLWSLGHPDRAAEAAVRSLEWARAINHGMTTGFSLSFGSALWGFFREEPRPGGADADEALAILRGARPESLHLVGAILLAGSLRCAMENKTTASN